MYYATVLLGVLPDISTLRTGNDIQLNRNEFKEGAKSPYM